MSPFSQYMSIMRLCATTCKGGIICTGSYVGYLEIAASALNWAFKDRTMTLSH